MLTCPCIPASSANRPSPVRAERVEAVFPFSGEGLPASRGLPGSNLLSFCVAKKKVSKEKGAPMVRVPPLRCGQPAVLAESGAELELAFGLYVMGVGVEGLASDSAAAADRRVEINQCGDEIRSP